MHRANLTYSDEEWKAMVKHCKKVRPYQRVTTTLKEITLLNCTSKCSNVTQLHSSVTFEDEKAAGTVRGLTRTGTDPDLKREEEEYIDGDVREMCQRVIGHFNRTCGGRVAILDQAAIKYLAAKLQAYTEADAMAVIDWGPTRWPPGDDWRERCLNITHLFGDKFGQYLTSANQHDDEPEFKPFHPGEEFMLKPIVPER